MKMVTGGILVASIVFGSASAQQSFEMDGSTSVYWSDEVAGDIRAILGNEANQLCVSLDDEEEHCFPVAELYRVKICQESVRVRRAEWRRESRYDEVETIEYTNRRCTPEYEITEIVID